MDISPKLRIRRKRALCGLGLGLTAAWLLTALGFAQTVSSTKSLLARLAAGKATGLKAGFSYAPAFPIQGQSVQFTDASMGNPAFWHWDFGDGVTSTYQSPAHTFRKSGFLKVTLTVTKGAHSKKTTKTISVLKEAASATFLFSPTTPGPGQAVQFKDMTAGGPTSWKWDFGDGMTSAVQNPTHTFAKESIYTVTLVAGTTTGSKKGSRSITVAAVSILSASFNYAPSVPRAGESVQFTDTSSGSPSSWKWEFGDGKSSTTRHPVHSFPTAGTYYVKLTVSASGGSKSATRAITVTSSLSASFTFSPITPAAGQAVQFTDTSTGNPTSWKWDFGDGSSSTERNPVHAYSTAGSYSVALTASHSTAADTRRVSLAIGSEDGLSGIYWASPTGTASWAAARSETPLAGAACCSLATANANASAGDTVYLRAGTYTRSLAPVRSGTAERRIVFQAYAGEVPTFTVNEAGGRWAVKLQGCSNVKIDGLRSVGSGAFFFIGYGAAYNEIANCTFDRSSGDYQLGFITDLNSSQTGTAWTHDNWLHHNTFSRYGAIDFILGQDLGTVRISNNFADRTSHNTFEDNVFFYGGHDCIDIGGRYNVIRRNVFHNEGAYFRDITKTLANVPASGYFGNRNILLSNSGDGPGTAFHTLIEGNRIGHAGTPPDDDGANGIENAGCHTLVRYNDIFGNGSMGYYSKMQPQGGQNTSLKSGSWARVYHNTIYRNGFGDAVIYGDQFKHGVSIWSYTTYDDWPTSVVVKNNIVCANYQEWRVGTLNILPQVSYVNNFNTDPGFINPDIADKTSLVLPDLRLQPGSPCVDAGAPLTQADGFGTASVTLVVDDAWPFQDGSWGSALTHGRTHFPDAIAVGTADNVAEIAAVDYASRTITLAAPLTWTDGAQIWLYRDSSGRLVFKGSAPDIGAHEIDR